MAFIRYKKRGSKWYAYEITAFWDQSSKNPKQKTKYLGVSDTNGGLITKPGRGKSSSEKSIVDFGDSYAINQLAETCGFVDIVKKNLPDFDTVMTLICYQMTEGSAMYNCQDWVDGNISKYLFPEADLKSQSISKLLNHLGKDDLQNKFFKDYIGKFFQGSRSVLIDSTALPSSINSSLNSWGHSSDGVDQKVGCLMLVDKTSKLPIYFRAVPGEIVDVSTLKISINQINRLGLKPESTILDAGYFSEGNIRYLCDENIAFTTRMPGSRKQFQQLIDEIGNMEVRANAVQYGKRVVFIKSREIDLYDHKMFAHVVLDPYKRAKDTARLITESFEDEQAEELTNFKMKYGGYIILISSCKIDKEDVLPTYYTRQSIEQVFGFAKSCNSILPLRVHSDQSIRGYLFLVFLSLVLFVMMRQKLMPKFTVEQALLNLRALKAKIYDKEAVILELNKKNKEITQLLKIIMPISMGI